jgi:hypothetical protein
VPTSSSEPSARTEPESADARAAEQTVEYIIHLNHKPCDKVIFAEAADGSNYHVICYKKYGAKHEINYLLDSASNDVVKSW